LDCTQVRSVIECYADGELDALTSATIERHLEQCAGCQGAIERLRSLSQLVREAAPYYAAPDRLSRRIRASVQERDAAPPRQVAGAWWDWLRPAALVAATAVVTWIAAPQLQRPPATDLLADEVISSHARATLTGHGTAVASSERHTVKPWLTSRLDFSPPVANLEAEGFPLIGARLDYVDRRPVGVLVYRRRQHVIDVFVWPDDERSAPASLELSKRGYQVLHWTDRGMRFWAISDLNAAELKTFAAQFSAK
jgi:anti-sigma factor RsiW